MSDHMMPVFGQMCESSFQVTEIHTSGEEDSVAQSHTAVVPRNRVEAPGLWAVGFVGFRGWGGPWFLLKKVIRLLD